MKYDVTITEILKKVIQVEADSPENAEYAVNEAWRNGEYILDADSFDGVEFEVNELRPEKTKVVILEPNKLARVAEIGTELKDLQNAVGGDIEAAYFFDEPVCMVVNEEGKINGLPLNRAVYDENKTMLDIIAGTAFICDCSGDNFGSLTDEQLKKYSERFKYPEQFFKTADGIKGVSFNPKSKEHER